MLTYIFDEPTCNRCCKRVATRECTERQIGWVRVCESCFNEPSMEHDRYCYVVPDGKFLPAFYSTFSSRKIQGLYVIFPDRTVRCFKDTYRWTYNGVCHVSLWSNGEVLDNMTEFIEVVW